MAKVITFGEIMLRLAPNGYYRFFQKMRLLSPGLLMMRLRIMRTTSVLYQKRVTARQIRRLQGRLFCTSGLFRAGKNGLFMKETLQ